LKRELSTAYIVRIRKGIAGRVVPFDKVYLFRKEDEKVISRVFKDAMVIPLTKRFAESLKEALSEKVDHTKPFVFYRKNEDAVRMLGSTVEKKLDKYQNYLGVIPVLFTKRGRFNPKPRKSPVTKNKQSFPSYLVATPESSFTQEKMKKILSARAYFLWDGNKIRPICLMCPKHHQFIQGACVPGAVECYDNLAKATPGDLVRGVRRYNELLEQNNEPILKMGGG